MQVSVSAAVMRRRRRNMRLIDADVMRREWFENGENEYVYDTNAA